MHGRSSKNRSSVSKRTIARRAAAVAVVEHDRAAPVQELEQPACFAER